MREMCACVCDACVMHEVCIRVCVLWCRNHAELLKKNLPSCPTWQTKQDAIKGSERQELIVQRWINAFMILVHNLQSSEMLQKLLKIGPNSLSTLHMDKLLATVQHLFPAQYSKQSSYAKVCKST